MAGTLTISTLSDGTNSTSSTNCIRGSALAWVNFSGSGSTSIRASYNVSSVTYVGTGSYTVNFTNAFSDANYAVCAWMTDSGRTFGQWGSATTTSFSLTTANANGANQDMPRGNISFFR